MCSRVIRESPAPLKQMEMDFPDEAALEDSTPSPSSSGLSVTYAAVHGGKRQQREKDSY